MTTERQITQITVGNYTHIDPDSKLTLERCCLFALCNDGSVWMMKDPRGDEMAEYWTQLPQPPTGS